MNLTLVQFSRPGGNPEPRLRDPALCLSEVQRPASVSKRSIKCDSAAEHLFTLFMRCMLLAKSAIFFKFQLIRRCPLILCCCIVFLLALSTRQNDIYSQKIPPYAIISLTTPAPTVRPPSRIANRSSFSIAMGVMSSAVILTLSPGIIISTPSGRFKIPVTSVVLK